MPTLEELVESGAIAAERCVRESKLIDYAWLADRAEIARGREPHHFYELIDRQYAALLGAIDGDSNGNP